jgi:hypothetical protein
MITAERKSNFITWMAAGISLLLVAGLFAAGKASLLRVAIPAGAALVALPLYLRRPIAYVQFTLWIWFLTPLVRRIVDLRMGYADQNLVLLAPFLVASIAGLTLFDRERAGNVHVAPFLLCIGGILYGFAVGMLLHPSGAVIYGLFNWLAPLLFGLHLYLRWPTYAEHKNAIEKTFVWGILVVGLYGIFQFVSPPSWDNFWLEMVEYTSINPNFGQPEPFAIRVWSTLNAPGPCADMLMAGLIIALVAKSKIRSASSLAGYLCFTLTLVRAAWLGWIVAFIYTAKATRSAALIRTVVVFVFAAVLLVPLAMSPAFSSISDRFASLSDISHDGSAQVRQEMYQKLAVEVERHPFGLGLNNSQEVDGFALDSSFLQMLFSLGWLGTALYLAGIVMLVLQKRQLFDKEDKFAAAMRGIQISLLLQSVAGNSFIGVVGCLFWIASCIYLCDENVATARSAAGEEWHANQVVLQSAILQSS